MMDFDLANNGALSTEILDEQKQGYNMALKGFYFGLDWPIMAAGLAYWYLKT